MQQPASRGAQGVGPNEARRPEMGRLLLGFLALAGSQAPDVFSNIVFEKLDKS